ncbi:unnamed protein product [Rotaria socialis]|uniref:TIR domain-containing protein n=1 Tax=Rotaria socialis TaxID=392032 RepID=A0A820VXP3_9BILA|nr:unnamed protein product [Rotaria socialis]CAF3427787.1 unnamed protein product [Rotaria socialis]CAF3545918.1 unnamed protein product [Rotaria socialis]CAF4388712.1 unnamed protein product [Rotaria socialis]CAF4465743.1 unnamed protein product [Rotaria socialis]
MQIIPRLVSLANIRAMDEFSKKYESLMKELREFIDEFFINIKDLYQDKMYMDLIDHILNIIWNLTDTTALVPMFVSAEYAKSVAEWIQKLSVRDPKERATKAVIAIIHNLSRDKKGLKALREKNLFEILTECKILLHVEDEDESNKLRQPFGMSLIALATSYDEQKRNESLICIVSGELFSKCKKAASCENWKFDGFHLSEFLNSLEVAFSNDTVVRHILDDNTGIKSESITFFAALLVSCYGLLFNQEADDLEKRTSEALLQILLCISNFPEYLKPLKEHNQFYVLIEGFAKQPKPNIANQPKQDIVKRIWSNLSMRENSTKEPHQLQVRKQPMAFISYNWADDKFCEKFLEELGKHTRIQLWVDYKNVAKTENNDWNSYAHAIERATIFIVLLSEAYCDSKYCFQELNYAVALTGGPTQVRDAFIFVETQKDASKKRERIKNLLNNMETIGYIEDLNQMAVKVAESIESLRNKNKTTTYSSSNIVQSSMCTMM